MNTDPISSWSLIERDPLLRMELARIELETDDPEAMVEELIGFFSMVDKMVKLTVQICEEVC